MCLGLAGCSAVDRFRLNRHYTDIYNVSINANEMTTIVKHEEYQELKLRIAAYLTISGYTKVIFENPSLGFMVIAKEETEPSQIILKYKRTLGEYKTRIDLIKGSKDLRTDSTVNEDIKEIAEKLEIE